MTGFRQILRIAQPAIWALLLVGTLAFATWAYFSRSGPVPLSVKAELSDQWATAVAWKTGRSSEPFAPSTMRPTQITARSFSIYVWNGTQFLLDIFASAPMEACTTGLHVADEIHVTADDPVTLTLEHDAGAGPWRMLNYGRSTFFLMVAAMRKDEADVGQPNGFYGLAEIKGKAGGGFKMRVASASDSPSCTGTFAVFKGETYTMWPPSYGGAGKEGVNRITLDAPAGARRFDHLGFMVRYAHQGIVVFAADATRFVAQDLAERVELSPKTGTLNFGRQFSAPLAPNVLLDIAFDKSNLGRLGLSSHASHGEPPLITVDGAASDMRLGDEDLTPRRIEGFPWWVQTVIGLAIAFCAERLYGSVRWAAHSRGTARPKRRPASSR